MLGHGGNPFQTAIFQEDEGWRSERSICTKIGLWPNQGYQVYPGVWLLWIYTVPTFTISIWTL